MRILLLSLLILATTVQAQISLAPGAKMPGVSAEWIRKAPSAGQQPVLPPKDFKNFLILTFVDAYSPDFAPTLRLMESLERRFAVPDKNFHVTVQTVAKNSKADLTKVMQSLSLPFQLNLGADVDGKTFRAFAVGVATLPYTFISMNGAIAWSGHPVEIDSVMDALIAEKFSIETQRKIAVHRSELQSALRSGLPDVVAQTADKILALSPRDSIAMQARLYSFQLKGQPAEATRFLADYIRKNPENSMQNRIILLNLLLQANQEAAWNKAVAETAAYALHKPEDALNFATYLLQNTAPVRLPVRDALQAAEYAEKQFRAAKNMPFLADALEALARANYAACRLDQAIRYQQEAVTLRETQKSPYLPDSRNMLNYYKNLKKL